MENINKIKKLLNVHFKGTPWIDYNIIDTLKSINAKQASAKVSELNSIWQIVNHMIDWRNALIGRVKDKPIPAPGNNFIYDVKNRSPKAWKDTLKRFERSQKSIISFLNKSKDPLLEKVSPTSGYSYYELLNAILQHDAYHLGQIMLMKKIVAAGNG